MALPEEEDLNDLDPSLEGDEGDEGEETASITAAAEEDAAVPQGGLSNLEFLRRRLLKREQASYAEALKQRGVLEQIQQAKLNLLKAPDRREAITGLVQKLTAPRAETDPRFYERRNLYTFLRDVGEYGQEQRDAEKKRQAAIAQLQEKYALERLKEAQTSGTRAQQLMAQYLSKEPKEQGETSRTRALREEAAARGMTLPQFLKWKDEQDKNKKDQDEGLSPAEFRSIRLDVGATLDPSKERLNIINEGLSNLDLAVKGNPQAEKQLNRSLATISGDKQLSIAEVESIVGAGSFAQRISNSISEFFTGGAGDLTNEQKKELLETYEAYHANQYNNARNRLKRIYAGFKDLPEDTFDAPYVSVQERRRRRDAEAAAEKATSETTSISLSGGKKVRPVGQ
jgi:hypothetical protein